LSNGSNVEAFDVVIIHDRLCNDFRWQRKSGHNKAQITYYLAENMELRKEEFVQILTNSCGCSREDAVKEVDESIHRLFHWAAYADKYGGNVQVR
jgi:NAD-dependent aldehyde dehydrogenases